MEIYYLDENYKTVGMSDRLSELVTVRRYFEPGEISAVLPPEEYGAIPGSAVYMYDPQSGECAHITGRTVRKSGEVELYGRTLEALLEQRIIYGDKVYTGSIESAVRSAVSANAISARAIPHLQLGPVVGLTDSAGLCASYDNLSEWVYKVLEVYGASYRIKLDREGYAVRFGIVKGLDRTRNQSENAPVCFKVMRTGEFDYSEDFAVNTAYVCGYDGTVVTVPSDAPSGLSRRETYVKASDIRPSAFEDTESYLEALRHRGAERLLGCKSINGITDGTAVFGTAEFGVDYGLGDLVEVETLLGKYTSRITSVREKISRGVRSVQPVIGYDAESVGRQIKRSIIGLINR